MDSIDRKIKNLIVSVCVDLSEGKTERLCDYLEAQDKDVKLEAKLLKVKGWYFSCGVWLYDPPIEQLVPVMYAMFGPLWMLVFESEYELAKRELRKITKEKSKVNSKR